MSVTSSVVAHARLATLAVRQRGSPCSPPGRTRDMMVCGECKGSGLCIRCGPGPKEQGKSCAACRDTRRCPKCRGTGEAGVTVDSGDDRECRQALRSVWPDSKGFISGSNETQNWTAS